MSDLYRGVFEESFREGVRMGTIQVLFWAVQKGYITVEEAAEESETTVNEFKELLKNPPAWVTQDR